MERLVQQTFNKLVLAGSQLGQIQSNAHSIALDSLINSLVEKKQQGCSPILSKCLVVAMTKFFLSTHSSIAAHCM